MSGDDLGKVAEGKLNKAASSFTFISPLDLAAESFRHQALDITIDGAPGERVVTRPAPGFHDDPDGAGLFPCLDAAIVRQSPAFTVFATCLRQVGYRSYLSRSGLLFNDEALVDEFEAQRYLTRFGSKTAFENEDTGLEPVDRPGLFRLNDRTRPVEYISGEVVSLCSHEPTNYGAFLMRVLPKIAGRRSLLRGRKVIGPLYNQSMRDLYSMAGIEVESLIPHNTQVIYIYDRAIVPSLRNAHFLLDPETLAFFADLRVRYGSRRKSRKIFVSRLGWSASYAANQRVMLNEKEVARRLVAEGFALVQPHTMTIREQIEAFSSADVIVGASGSAMFNAVFTHPGTTLIDIESEPHWIFAHQNLFASCGLDYGIFEGKTQDQDWSVPHKPFTVNVEALMSRVGACAAEPLPFLAAALRQTAESAEDKFVEASLREQEARAAAERRHADLTLALARSKKRCKRRKMPRSLNVLERILHKSKRRIASDYRLLASSPLFDADWYGMEYPDVAQFNRDPILDYLARGGEEGRQPGPVFDGQRYLAANPDVRAAGQNPLVHYLRFGVHEKRNLRTD